MSALWALQERIAALEQQLAEREEQIESLRESVAAHAGLKELLNEQTIKVSEVEQQLAEAAAELLSDDDPEFSEQLATDNDNMLLRGELESLREQLRLEQEARQRDIDQGNEMCDGLRRDYESVVEQLRAARE